MKPRHFWWLFDTLETRKTPGGSLTADDRSNLKKMLADAKAKAKQKGAVNDRTG